MLSGAHACPHCGRRLVRGLNCSRCPRESRWRLAEPDTRGAITVEDLTPVDRMQAQEHFLRRWLALRCKHGTRRRTDQAGPVKRYDEKGRYAV